VRTSAGWENQRRLLANQKERKQLQDDVKVGLGATVFPSTTVNRGRSRDNGKLSTGTEEVQNYFGKPIRGKRS
jgi:hypothetical protein